MFSMSSCIATSRMVHNGGYIQKQLQLFNSPEVLWFGRLYIVTKVLLNLYRFYSILATTQCFRLWESVTMDQFVMFRERVYEKYTYYVKTAIGSQAGSTKLFQRLKHIDLFCLCMTPFTSKQPNIQATICSRPQGIVKITPKPTMNN